VGQSGTGPRGGGAKCPKRGKTPHEAEDEASSDYQSWFDFGFEQSCDYQSWFDFDESSKIIDFREDSSPKSSAMILHQSFDLKKSRKDLPPTVVDATVGAWATLGGYLMLKAKHNGDQMVVNSTDELVYVDDQPFTVEEIQAMFGILEDDLSDFGINLFAEALKNGGKW
jgi:hypothetical protein